VMRNLEAGHIYGALDLPPADVSARLTELAQEAFDQLSRLAASELQPPPARRVGRDPGPLSTERHLGQ
jgi:hypothetical protein